MLQLLLCTDLIELKPRSVVSFEITDSMNLAQNIFLKHGMYCNSFQDFSMSTYLFQSYVVNLLQSA